jgi:germination protein M
MADKKKKNTGFALSCWVVVALILLIFFLVKKDTIITNLKQTDFFNRLFGSTPEFVQNQQIPDKQADTSLPMDVTPPDSADKKSQNKEETEKENYGTTQTTPPVTSVPSETAEQPESKESGTLNTEHINKNIITQELQQKPISPSPSLLKTNLCFVIIDSDGTVSRKIVTRQLHKTDGPLSDTIKALLAGPTPAEKSQNCMTLIPNGSKLLSATIKNGIATLNFSDDFEINTIGVEGYIGQLMQIVYTATSFPTVNSVQFIIEGEKKEYLGSEGQWIGSPLSRSSFR